MSLGGTVWLLPLWGRIQGVAVDAKPLELTAERTEGRLLDLLPFCVSSHSDEAYSPLFITPQANPDATLSTTQDATRSPLPLYTIRAVMNTAWRLDWVGVLLVFTMISCASNTKVLDAIDFSFLRIRPTGQWC